MTEQKRSKPKWISVIRIETTRPVYLRLDAINGILLNEGKGLPDPDLSTILINNIKIIIKTEHAKEIISRLDRVIHIR